MSSLRKDRIILFAMAVDCYTFIMYLIKFGIGAQTIKNS